ncbi:MAG: acyltransferase, partial [Thermodesulfovibrionia bacterium]|nr:acyltransferase [Thermodesulfovibrionia bacterium]
MRAAFYQFNPSFGKKEENVKKVLSAVKDIKVELLVLPEFFATGYQFVSADEVAELSEPVSGGYTTEFLLDLSRKKTSYIVAGIAEKDGSTFYNSAVLIG